MAEKPTEEEAQLWQRRLGAQANNRAWALAEKASRTPEEDAAMLHAAHASRHLWGRVGTERNFALADLLLGQVHALLGNGQAAMQYANSAFAYFTSHASEAWELAFAHAVLANAAQAAALPDKHRANYARALEIADTLTNKEDRKVFDATFAVIPKPAQEKSAG